MLEVAIGIVFIFVLVSIICTSIREGLEGWIKSRAVFLEHGIREMLHDKTAQGLAKELYNHPLIYSLFDGHYEGVQRKKSPGALTSGGSLPSYIPAKNFALALLDLAAQRPALNANSTLSGAPLLSLSSLRSSVLALENERVQRALLTAIDTAQGDFNKAQQNLEDWYNSAMDRVSGAYRRSTQWALFWIGLLVAVLLNIDTINLANYLYHNDAAREVLVTRAEAFARDTTGRKLNDYNLARAQLDSLDLPIGWKLPQDAARSSKTAAATPPNATATPSQTANRPVKPDVSRELFTEAFWHSLPGRIPGWLLTALAATLGAPFWFDLLNKIMVIRSTVKPHEKSLEEDSEDRQLTKKAAPPAAPAPQPALNPVVAVNPTALNTISNDPAPPDVQSELDGCITHTGNHVAQGNEDITLDEHLPVAEGGVA